MGVNEIQFGRIGASQGLNDGLKMGAALGGMYRNNRIQDKELDQKEAQRMIDDMARDASVALEIQDPNELRAFLQRRVDRIKANGGDPSDTMSIMNLPEAQLRQELQRVYQKAAPVSSLGKQGVKVRSQQMYKDGTVIQSTDTGTIVYDPSGKRVEGKEAEDVLKKAAEFEVKFVGESNYSKQSGTNQADIDSGGDAAEVKKFGEMQGSSRAKAIDKGFESITTIRSTVSNLKRGLEALDEGATSGAIANRLSPVVRASTVKLRDVQNALALDVLNAATFGALSEKELEMAQQQGLPTDLPPNELRAHINQKIAAQEKLMEYFQDQIDFLDNGGTVAGFVRKMRRESEQGEALPEPTNDTPSSNGNANTFTSKSGITFEVN